MEFIKVILLGILEGVTEFLPISSTGHLILASEVLALHSQSFENAFSVIIQLGAILSVVVLYFNRLNPFAKAKLVGIDTDGEVSFKDRLIHRDPATMRLIAKIIIGFLPAAVLGFLFDDLIDKYLFNPTVVAVTLIFYGVVIIVMERQKRTSYKIDSLEHLSVKDAFKIGFFQCLAMIPGTSRSAATIIGGMLIGCNRKSAAEFSFFLAIPTMIGATMLKILKLGAGFTLSEWGLIALGFVVSFAVAYAVIVKFLSYIQKHDFQIFGIYRIVLGVAVLVLLAF
ncbi:undecaprenyl-diphosphate phosphatase [Peptoniphilus equinus]|uniref:Undecaprenyl-diphosphatase n=1 Tax=Peptoniphilus equinus TaxID=3016343 RepID=A0ABY7QSV4_9FIRM|nr:undecaprenyl-diphosphate phosphatase [Peptoniphilus equinus]WBW49862.1 undecaprenyl-diphosphate phosphatase [Peptoniphilus equinus]